MTTSCSWTGIVVYWMSASRTVAHTFARLRYDSGDWDYNPKVAANVLNSLVEYTTLRVDTAERIVALADPKMLEAPFCYLAGHKLVQFTPSERRNFERATAYLQRSSGDFARFISAPLAAGDYDALGRAVRQAWPQVSTVPR